MDIKNLYKKFLDCTSVSTDTRTLAKDSIFFALSGPNFNGNKFAVQAIDKGAKYVVIDDKSYNGGDPQYILVNNTLNALQLLSTYHRDQINCKILALTGSNGKTTTKELVSRVLSKKYKTFATQGNYNNHIGVPITLLNATQDLEFLVVEMGANHQGEIMELCEIAKPDFGFITNIGKAHLEGFGGLEGVRKGKSEMYRYLDAHQGLIFVNTDNDELRELVRPYCNIHSYNNQSISIYESTNALHFFYEGFEYKSSLSGIYNLENIINAIQIGKYFEVEVYDIVDAIHSYVPKNNRSESVSIGSIEIFKDAYNANPTSLMASLISFLKRIDEGQQDYQIVLGDMLELGEYSEMEHFEVLSFLYQKGIKNVIAIGLQFSKLADKFPYVFYSDVDAYIKYINVEKLQEHYIFLKGSRGLKLERIVERISDVINGN
jgi:UDP-N-acetylmuramoyl-tripeptide--D-alanyl-D-alanine ligase